MLFGQQRSTCFVLGRPISLGLPQLTTLTTPVVLCRRGSRSRFLQQAQPCTKNPPHPPPLRRTCSAKTATAASCVACRCPYFCLLILTFHKCTAAAGRVLGAHLYHRRSGERQERFQHCKLGRAVHAIWPLQASGGAQPPFLTSSTAKEWSELAVEQGCCCTEWLRTSFVLASTSPLRNAGQRASNIVHPIGLTASQLCDVKAAKPDLTTMHH